METQNAIVPNCVSTKLQILHFNDFSFFLNFQIKNHETQLTTDSNVHRKDRFHIMLFSRCIVHYTRTVYCHHRRAQDNFDLHGGFCVLQGGSDMPVGKRCTHCMHQADVVTCRLGAHVICGICGPVHMVTSMDARLGSRSLQCRALARMHSNMFQHMRIRAQGLVCFTYCVMDNALM